MTTPLRIGIVPFDEAIAAAKARNIVLPDVYYGKLRGIARAEAFSVAGIASLDQLTVVLRAMVKALEAGADFRQWKDQILKSEAALALPKHRLENIFRTNIQGAYARGRCVHVQNNKDQRPYLVYSAINDSRTRPAHLAMNGYVAAVDDPIWQEWTPPNGYQCRCAIVSLTEAQAAKHMAKDAERMRDVDFAEARQSALINGPDEGWDYSPCDGLRLPPGVPHKPEGTPPKVLESTSPGLVRSIKRVRHPALASGAEALLTGFLMLLWEALGDAAQAKGAPNE